MIFGDHVIDGVAINEDNRQTEFVLPDDKEGMKILRDWLLSFRLAGIRSTLYLSGRGYACYRTGRDTTFDGTDENYGI